MKMKIYVTLFFSFLVFGNLVGSASCDILVCLDKNVKKTDSLEIGYQNATYVLQHSERCQTIAVDCTSDYFYMSVNGGYETMAHKVPNLVLFTKGEEIGVVGDPVNNFLLNRYSILDNYSFDWKLSIPEYYAAVDETLDSNTRLIKESLSDSKYQSIREDMIMVEKMIASHYLSNYKNVNSRKNPDIKMDLLRYLSTQDLTDTRFEFNVNNINFQYTLFMDSIIGGMPDELYPYAAFEALNESVSLSSVKRMIADRVLISSVADSTIVIDSLVGLYISHIGEIRKGSKVDLTLDGSYGLKVGESIPSFSNLTDKGGNLHSREDLLGKDMVLMTWGTWCPYCATEFKHIKAVQEKFPDVAFVFVSFDKQSDKWKQRISNLDLNGLHLIDPENNSNFKSNYMVNTTNRFFLVDKNGILLAREGLSPSKGDLDKMIKKHF